MRTRVDLSQISNLLESGYTGPWEPLLNTLEQVTHIEDSGKPEAEVAAVDRFMAAFMPYLEAHLSNSYQQWKTRASKELYQVVGQLECIAALTGVKSAMLEIADIKYTFKLPNLDKYAATNFLHRKEPLAFRHFNRSLLTIQLLLRVLDTKKIQQGQQQICGPTAFMQSIADSDPLTYMHFVTGLAEHGEHVMRFRDTAEGLAVKITNSSLLDHPSRYDANGKEDEADLIAQAGLRESENKLFHFTHGDTYFHRTLFGVTYTTEIEAWMNLVGYKYVHMSDLVTPDQIEQLNKLLKLGYTIIYATTSQITNAIFAGDFSSPPGKIEKLLHGHLIWLNNIRYLKDTNQVVISITSWGREQKDCVMSYDNFVKFHGQSHVCIGLSPPAEARLRSNARRHSYGNRVHPYEFCSRIRAELKGILDRCNSGKQPQCIVALYNELMDNFASLKERNWTLFAKNFQDKLLALKQLDEYQRADSSLKKEINSIVREYCSCAIINEQTIHWANDQLKLLKDPDLSAEQRDKIELMDFNLDQLDLPMLERKNVVVASILGAGMSEMEDIDAARLLIQYHLRKDMLDSAHQDLLSVLDAPWANHCDKLMCKRVFTEGLKIKLLDLLAPDTTVTQQDITRMHSYIRALERTSETEICLNLLELLQQRKCPPAPGEYSKNKIELLKQFIDSYVEDQKAHTVSILQQKLTGNIGTVIKSSEIDDLLAAAAKNTNPPPSPESMRKMSWKLKAMKDTKTRHNKEIIELASHASIFQKNTDLLLAEMLHIIPPSPFREELNQFLKALHQLRLEYKHNAVNYNQAVKSQPHTFYGSNHSIDLLHKAEKNLLSSHDLYMQLLQKIHFYLRSDAKSHNHEYSIEKIELIHTALRDIYAKANDMAEINDALTAFNDCLQESNNHMAAMAYKMINPSQSAVSKLFQPASPVAAASSQVSQQNRGDKAPGVS